MPRRTRKKHRSRRKTPGAHTSKSGRKKISLLAKDADLDQVIAKLNTVINVCCLGGKEPESTGRVLTGLDPQMLDLSPASSAKKKVIPRRSKRLAHKRSTKKRGKNEYFKKMLAAKAAKAPSFQYKGNTYKATKGGNAGQLIVYKKV